MESIIINNTKSLCSRHFCDIKKTENIRNNLRKQYLIEPIFAETEQNTELRSAFYEAYKKLTEDELLIYNLYYNTKHSFVIMGEILSKSTDCLKKRIQRIKQKLKAETNIILGMEVSKEILTPQVSNLIYMFLRSFKEHTDTNSVHDMYYYFSRTHFKYFRDDIHIKKVGKYGVDLKNHVYTILVSYIDYQDKKNLFDMKFMVENNHLYVLQVPCIMQSAASFPLDSEAAKEIKNLISLYPPNRKGVLTIPKEIIEDLIAKHQKKEPVD